MAVIRINGKRTVVCGGCGEQDPPWTWAGQPVCRRCWRWLKARMHERQETGKTQQGWLRGYLQERDGCCRYCGTTEGPLTIDHIIPKSRGGIRTPWNAVLSCEPCQNRKANHLPEHVGMRLRPLEVANG